MKWREKRGTDAVIWRDSGVTGCTMHMMSESVFWIVNLVAMVAMSAGALALVMPRIVLLSYRRHLFDVPCGRKLHRERVSRLGGVVFLPVMVFGMLGVMAVNLLSGSVILVDVMASEPRQWVCAMCAMLLLYFTGLRDDLLSLSAWSKLLSQVAAGVLLAFGGCRLEVFSGFMGMGCIGDVGGIVVTVFATVLILNAINFIDGIDGLASVVCGLCFVWQGVMGFSVESYDVAVAAMGGLGVSGAFLFFNLRGVRGKRVFMGDTGSLTLGFLSIWLALRLDGSGGVGVGGVSPFLMFATPLMVACLDAIRVVVRRVCHGGNPMCADTTHLHHLLYGRGLSAWRVTMTIGVLSVVIMVLNVVLASVCSASIIVIADVGVFFVFFVVAGKFGTVHSNKDGM